MAEPSTPRVQTRDKKIRRNRRQKEHLQACADVNEGYLHMLLKRGRHEDGFMASHARQALQANMCDVNAKNSRGETALHVCAMLENECHDVLQVLFEFNVDCNAKDMRGDTPLHTACRAGNWDATLALVSRCKPVANNEGKYPHELMDKILRPHMLKRAAENGVLVLLNWFISDELLNTKFENGETLLHIACRNSRTEIAMHLLGIGAAGDVLNANGESALISACKSKKGCTGELAEALLKSGSELETQNFQGETALTFLCVAPHDGNALRLILQRRTDQRNALLDLGNCGIRAFASTAVAFFSQYRTVDLRNNELHTLPAEFVELPMLEKMLLEGNPLSHLPKNVRGSWAKVKRYLRGFADSASRWKERKIVFVGEEGVGKTTLVQCLKNKKHKNACKENVSTNGIDIHFSAELGGMDSKSADLSLNLWDLGGQEVFYPTHQFFLTSNAVYILVFNAARFHESRVDYWMRQIRQLSSNTPKAPVFLIGTHCDDASLTPDAMESMRTDLLSKFHKYCFRGFQDVIMVSCKSGKGIAEFKQVLGELLMDKVLFTSVVPDSWANLRSVLGRRTEEQVDWKTYEHWAIQCGLTDESDLMLATEFLHDSGALVYFGDGFNELSNIVILKPQWLADVMSSLITFGHGWVKEGILPSSFVSLVFHSYPAELHPTLLALLERFEIVYSIHLGDPPQLQYVVPSKLPADPPDSLREKWRDVRPAGVDEYERSFVFPFLPLGFFGRVMIRVLHIQRLDPLLFWQHGVMIRERNTRNALLLQSSKDHMCLNVTLRLPGKSVSMFSTQDAARLLLSVTSVIDTLIDCFYKAEYDVDRFLSCPHCMREGVPPGERFQFVMSECVDAISRGVPFIHCRHIASASRAVQIDAIAPDMMFGGARVLDDKNVEMGEMLGRGGFGIVHKGVMLKGAKQIDVAVKQVFLRQGEERARKKGGGSRLELDNSGDRVFLEFQKEVFMMSYVRAATNQGINLTIFRGLRHENIVCLYGVMHNPLRMVIELAELGDLNKLLHPDSSNASFIEPSRFPWLLRLLIARDIARGMQYLSSLTPAVVHRDLRSANVFLCSLSQSVATVRAKIGDFGLSRFLTPDVSGALNTWQWLAPEVISADSGASYDHKSDVYSFGIVCWEIATRGYPFDEFYDAPRFTIQLPDGRKRMDEIAIKKAVVEENLRPSMPIATENCPGAFTELITQCLSRDPKDRPEFEDACQRLSAMSGVDPSPAVTVDPRSKLSHTPSLFQIQMKHDTVSAVVEEDAPPAVEVVMVFDMKLPNRSHGLCMTTIKDRIWIGGSDGMITSFIASDCGDMQRWRAHTSLITLMINASGQVWTSASDGYIRVWKEDGTFVKEWRSYKRKEAVRVTAMSTVTLRGIKTVWTAYDNRSNICVWNARTFRMMHVVSVPNNKDSISGIVATLDRIWISFGNQLYVLGQDLAAQAQWEAHPCAISILAKRKKTILSGGEDGRIFGWTVSDEEIVPRLDLSVHQRVVLSLCATPSGFWSGAGSGLIVVWDKLGNALQDIDCHQVAVTCICRAGDVMFTCGRDGTVVLWNEAKKASSSKLPRRRKKLTKGTRSLVSLSERM